MTFFALSVRLVCKIGHSCVKLPPFSLPPLLSFSEKQQISPTCPARKKLVNSFRSQRIRERNARDQKKNKETHLRLLPPLHLNAMFQTIKKEGEKKEEEEKGKKERRAVREWNVRICKPRSIEEEEWDDDGDTGCGIRRFKAIPNDHTFSRLAY